MSATRAVLETTDEGLYRALTRWNALAIVVGAVVGTGIYLRPASIAQLVQTPTAILVVWLGAGLVTMAGALTYSGEVPTEGDYPRSFNIDPTGSFLYACNQRSDAITTFRVNSKTGGLTFTGRYTPVGTPAAIIFLP